VGVVDSIRPRTEVLGEFQERYPEVTALSGGAESQAALTQRFLQALSSRDSADVSKLLISPSEFAWLYYPTTRVSLPPYELAPDLLWFQLDGQSRQGFSAALNDLGGRQLHYGGVDCPATPVVEGKNRIWAPCAVRFRVGEEKERSARLFGPIIERDGAFKLVGLGNSLD
jgi:hypothetical protein